MEPPPPAVGAPSPSPTVEAPPPPAKPSKKAARAVFAVTGVYNLLVGAVLLGTLGIRGFQGAAGEDSLLAAIIGYESIAMLALAGLALYLAVRPSRGLPRIVGIGVIVIGILLFLHTLFPFGIINIVLGVAVLLVRKRA